MTTATTDRALGILTRLELPRSAIAVTDDLSPGWGARAVREARAVVARRLDGFERQRMEAAIAVLDSPEPSAAIGRLGAERWRVVLLALLDNDLAAATTAILAPAADYDARRRALRDDTVFDVPAAVQQGRDAVLLVDDTLGDLGPKIRAAAVPFLLAAFTPSSVSA